MIVLCFLNQPAFFPAREAAIWELEERHLQEKHQLLKQQLKDQYFMQRHQLLKRHEKVSVDFNTSFCVLNQKYILYLLDLQYISDL